MQKTIIPSVFFEAPWNDEMNEPRQQQQQQQQQREHQQLAEKSSPAL